MLPKECAGLLGACRQRFRSAGYISFLGEFCDCLHMVLHIPTYWFDGLTHVSASQAPEVPEDDESKTTTTSRIGEQRRRNS